MKPSEVPAWSVVERSEDYRCRILAVERRRAVEAGTGVAGEFHVLSLPDWVNVVALTDADELVLVEQWRHGVERRTLELPGGVIDPGEGAAGAGARELLEETGYAARSWSPLGAIDPNPAIQGNRCHGLVALGCAPVAEPRFDAHERCRVVLVPWAALPERVAEGALTHALALAVLHLEDLRRRGARPSPGAP